MSGYSVEWKHKAPKPTAKKEYIASTSKTPVITYTPPPTVARIVIQKETDKKAAYSLQYNLPVITNSSKKDLVIYTLASYPEKPVFATNEIDTTIQKTAKHPHFFTGDEEEDEYAHKSLVDGILALASPAATFLIMLGIAFSVGETIATGPTYAIAIFALGCAAGLVFAIFAFINGFQGLNEISAQPDTYTGAGDAVLGMILAALEPLGIIAYFLIRSL